ncbi:di-trans,poly-cis-decaprenylcistransferase [archaeon]|nr:di-trans,poly-cis-decaprenylcistransferase [archaeon]
MLEKSMVPRHVAIILDGNRRFAKKLVLEPWKGHSYGKKRVEELLDYAKEFGVREITFYCLSSENLNRPVKELDYLYDLFRETFRGMDRSRLNEEGVCLKFIGDLDLLPSDLKDICVELENCSSEGNRFIVNFCIAYGGRAEIVRAVRRIVESGVRDVDSEVVEKNLLLSSEPDLIIRTGGQKRISNFLLWQGAYSEWIFLDKMWPEVCRDDFVECVEEFGKRKRNFGK